VSVVTDSAVALIRTPEAITPQWLTGVLQAEGSLPSDSRVHSLTAQLIGEGVGVLSRIYRVTPTYAPEQAPGHQPGQGGAPTTVVVKLATENEIQRLTADLLSAFRREVVFYAELAEAAPFRTPRCFAAVQAADNSDFTLVLEDLAGVRFQDQIAGCSWEDSLRSVEALAGFHAQGTTRPPAHPELYLPLLNDGYLAMLPVLFEQNWGAAKAIFGDLITPEVAAFGDRWGHHCEFMLRELMSPYTSMCHGDWRADNIMFAQRADGSGEEVLAIDFQLMGIGSGTYDVAYFVSQSIDPDVRNGRDREIVEHYVAALQRQGLETDTEAVWRQYRVGLLFDLSYPVNSALAWESLAPRAQALIRSMFTRAASAIADTKAYEVLPAEA
jgi:hypothetical protein